MGLCCQSQKWTFSEQHHSPSSSHTLHKQKEKVKARLSPTLVCCEVVGGNWRTQEAHEIVRRGKWCGWVNNKAWNYQW
ncbi:hypothetical protein GYH30_019354 [Glycine max]|uniref:Uncharacterized protein n=1 Tax=Glycine max TaxID=3847 RepID=K7L3G8_SOYBN|nr:hypothetical protein GYH30_019354 [Glycine max]